MRPGNNVEAILDLLGRASSYYWVRIEQTLQPTGGEVPKEQFPIESGTRKWLHVNFIPFRLTSDSIHVVAVILAARSDGRLFHVDVCLQGNLAPRDALRRADVEIPQAIDILQSYRDCSCGIVGYRSTGERDEEGNLIKLPIFNLCLIHPEKDLDFHRA